MNPSSFKFSFFFYILQVEVLLLLYLRGNLQEMPSLSKNCIRLYRKYKEAKILYHINHSNVVSLLGVCENPMTLMMDFSEFSFAPYGNYLISHSLDVFLKTLDENDFVPSFPNLFNFVAKGIFTGLAYLHENNIVHRDIKLSHILVSNTHYSSEEPTKREELFAEQPVVCKIADLVEAQSLVTQTCMVGKTKTKYLERGTAAFMAPEIMIEECMLQTAGIEDLKRIDIWAAVVTLFVSLNPDQRYPFEKDIKLLKANTGNVCFSTKCRAFVGKVLERQASANEFWKVYGTTSMLLSKIKTYFSTKYGIWP